MSRQTAVRRASSGRGRTGRRVNSTGRALQTTPDASRQRRSKSEGINAATTDAQSANSSPILSSVPPERTTRVRRSGRPSTTTSKPPVDGSSPQILRRSLRQSEEGARLWNPSSLDHNLTYQPSHSLKKTGQRHVEPEQQRDSATASDLAPVERTPTPEDSHR